MERNREDSKKWLFNTEDGRVRLELDTKKLMKVDRAVVAMCLHCF